MVIDTFRFGRLEFAEESLVTLPEGLLGFPDDRRFLVLPFRYESGAGGPGPSSLCWLQSADDPQLAFLAVEPHLFFPDYEVDLPEEDASALELRDARQASVLALLTVSRGATRGSERFPLPPMAVTANLAGPIVINVRSRQGRQVLLAEGRYGTKHVLAEMDDEKMARGTSRGG